VTEAFGRRPFGPAQVGVAVQLAAQGLGVRELWAEMGDQVGQQSLRFRARPGGHRGHLAGNPAIALRAVRDASPGRGPAQAAVGASGRKTWMLTPPRRRAGRPCPPAPRAARADRAGRRGARASASRPPAVRPDAAPGRIRRGCGARRHTGRRPGSGRRPAGRTRRPRPRRRSCGRRGRRPWQRPSTRPVRSPRPRRRRRGPGPGSTPCPPPPRARGAGPRGGSRLPLPQARTTRTRARAAARPTSPRCRRCPARDHPAGSRSPASPRRRSGRTRRPARVRRPRRPDPARSRSGGRPADRARPRCPPVTSR